tara:strand:- start:1568 stop:1810 length:243 start_codon:yes stop_codon:yes gene_type:complete
VSVLREVGQGKRNKKIQLGYQHLKKVKMDIQQIAEHMVGKIVDAVDVVYGEDTMIIYLDDGSDIELIIDSIHANVPDLDD